MLTLFYDDTAMTLLALAAVALAQLAFAAGTLTRWPR